MHLYSKNNARTQSVQAKWGMILFQIALFLLIIIAIEQETEGIFLMLPQNLFHPTFYCSKKIVTTAIKEEIELKEYF